MRRFLAKSPMVVVGPILIAGILLSGAILLHYRTRFDADLWIWAGVLIVGIMALSVPLTIWHQKASATGKFLRPPWPTPATSPDAVPEHPAPGEASLRGSFTWTTAEFVRMRNAWLQHTPAGRNHRRTMWSLCGIGVAGTSAGAVWLAQGLLLASTLLVASLTLLAFVVSCRIRVPEEARAHAQVSWELFPEGILLQTGDSKRELRWHLMRAILRTRDGFLLWPEDLYETWLPVQAFARPEDVELFSKIAGSRVANYVHEN